MNGTNFQDNYRNPDALGSYGDKVREDYNGAFMEVVRDAVAEAQAKIAAHKVKNPVLMMRMSQDAEYAQAMVDDHLASAHRQAVGLAGEV